MSEYFYEYNNINENIISSDISDYLKNYFLFLAEYFISIFKIYIGINLYLARASIHAVKTGFENFFELDYNITNDDYIKNIFFNSSLIEFFFYFSFIFISSYFIYNLTKDTILSIKKYFNISFNPFFLFNFLLGIFILNFLMDVEVLDMQNDFSLKLFMNTAFIYIFFAFSYIYFKLKSIYKYLIKEKIESVTKIDGIEEDENEDLKKTSFNLKG